MKKELFKYKGEVFEVEVFETVVINNKPINPQIEQLLKEDADTKSGKRKIKPLVKGAPIIEV